MDILRWISVIDRVGDGIRHRLATREIVRCGLIFIIVAAGVGAVASYVWLATALPNYLAAFCVAGALLVVGGVIIAVANSRGRRAHGRPGAIRSSDTAGHAEMAVDSAIEAALAEVKKSPSPALLVALGLGLVIGLLRPKDD